MPRTARIKGESHVYHVMLRGINKQTIFEDHQDETVFLALLDKYKPLCGFELYGYCFMGNHVHLLIHEAKRSVVTVDGNGELKVTAGEELGEVLKHICISYVMYFNHKYPVF